MEGDKSKGTSLKFKRTFRACLSCRVRKIKCDLGSLDLPRDGKCLRCLRERKDCVFVETRRGSDPTSVHRAETSSGPGSPGLTKSGISSRSPSQIDVTTISGNKGESEVEGLSSGSTTNGNPESPSSQQRSNHFSTMEGALVFLAKAAGTIAKADERDHIDAEKKHEQLEMSISSSSSERDMTKGSLSNILNPNINPSSNRMVRPDLQESSNHQRIPSSTPAPTNTSSTSSSTHQLHKTHLHQNHTHTNNHERPKQQRFVPLAEKPEMIRPKATNKLSNFEYIGLPNGILSEEEAETLIHLFFTTMHPFFPFIPKFLHEPKVLAGYPILLCAILTIASRYHPFTQNVGNGGVPRNIEVHDTLWLYVQRLISQTVWAEASTRSIGTIFAFLLFTEWNPRAIHWRWSDYANKAEDNDANDTQKVDGETNLTGIGAMRRSYRMGWMLIGSAVRLAQDMGFMEVSTNVFLATHIAEINCVMNNSRRSILSHSLSELDLDEEEDVDLNGYNDDKDLRIMGMSEEELREISFSPHSTLKFSLIQKAKIELLQVTCLGHESFYGYKAQLGSLTQRQHLSVLNILSPILNNWSRKYKQLLVPSKPKQFHSLANLQQHLLNPDSKVAKEIFESIDQESLIFEYNYTKLYIYSLALSPTQLNDSNEASGKRKANKVLLKMDEISRAAKFIEQAFAAANQMLSVTQRIHRMKMLLYMPVRWVTRIVRAIAFVVKCYLTLIAHNKTQGSLTTMGTPGNPNNSFEGFDSTVLSLSLISIDEIMLTIQRAAITLRDCSPDELHLCTRYSNVLMYLCSEMKTKTKTNPSSGQEPGYPLAKKRRTSFESSQTPGDEMQKLMPTLASNDSYNHISAFNFPLYFSQNGASGQNITSEAITPEGVNIDQLMGDSEVMDWFSNNKDIGLDFVGPWTEMIEQQLDSRDFNFDEALQ